VTASVSATASAPWDDIPSGLPMSTSTGVHTSTESLSVSTGVSVDLTNGECLSALSVRQAVFVQCMPVLFVAFVVLEIHTVPPTNVLEALHAVWLVVAMELSTVRVASEVWHGAWSCGWSWCLFDLRDVATYLIHSLAILRKNLMQLSNGIVIKNVPVVGGCTAMSPHVDLG